MPNKAKIAQVEDLTTKLKATRSAALVQYQGLNALEISKLRDEIKAAGGILEVAKNTLISRAFAALGQNLPEELTGPTAIAFGQTDEIAPLKAFDKTTKDKEGMVFKYGFFEGKLLSPSELKQLLSLPSKSALLAQLLSGLQNPLLRLAYAGKYHQTRLALALKALADKKSAQA